MSSRLQSAPHCHFDADRTPHRRGRSAAAGGGTSAPRWALSLRALAADAGSSLLLRPVLLHPLLDLFDLLPLLVGQDQPHLEQHLEAFILELLTSCLKDRVGRSHRRRVEVLLVDRFREIEPCLVHIGLEIDHPPRVLEDDSPDLILLFVGETDMVDQSRVFPPLARGEIEIVRRQRARQRETRDDDQCYLDVCVDLRPQTKYGFQKSIRPIPDR